jgi:competence protein ComEC
MYGNQSILLTGDLPSEYEGFLLQEILPKGVTIYKAGHHGSKYSSGNQLLSYIRPEYAVISAGRNNKYGHPNSESLERLTQYSKHVISTMESGTISFLLDGATVSVDTDH